MAKDLSTREKILKRLKSMDATLEESLNANVNSSNDQDKNGYSQWAMHNGGKYTPTMPTTKAIPPGFYEVNIDSAIGVYLQKKSVTTDELYELPSKELSDIIIDIEKFWDRADIYKKMNFVHKRGILLYGDPGCGKSGIIQLCTKHLIQNMSGIVINITNGDQIEHYQSIVGPLREVEPERPLIVILEDIDSIAGEGSWSTSMLLNLLDGIKQIDNVVYIATTNYPEKLEERITNRPSRFDRRYEIDLPNEDVRRTYITAKLGDDGISKSDLNLWVKETKGMSLAHLRELIISVSAMGNTFEDTISRLNGLKIKPEISKKKRKSVGFSGYED
jgi:predicted AAA+ superfamily ATPase